MYKFTLIFVLFVSGIAATSFLMKTKWSGGFSQAEYRIEVNANGSPISNAKIEIIDSDNNKCYIYPICNYHSNQTLKTNSDGLAVINHIEQGVEFGGESWKLFFLIEMGDKPTEYFVSINHEDFKSRKVPYRFLETKTDLMQGKSPMTSKKSYSELRPYADDTNEVLEFPIIPIKVDVSTGHYE